MGAKSREMEQGRPSPADEIRDLDVTRLRGRLKCALDRSHLELMLEKSLRIYPSGKLLIDGIPIPFVFLFSVAALGRSHILDKIPR